MIKAIRERVHSDDGISPVKMRTRIRWGAMIIGAAIAMSCAAFPELHLIVPGIATVPNLVGEHLNKLLNI